jgi:hypothetical protein
MVVLLKKVQFGGDEGIAENEKSTHDCKEVVHKSARMRGDANSWHRRVVTNHPIAISSE